MTEIDSLYPPAPKDVPADLARPGFRYGLMVALVLLALFLFLLIYLALMAGSLGILVWAIDPPAEVVIKLSGSTATRIVFVVLRLGLCAASVMFFAFLFKGLLPKQANDAANYVEITEADQPRLFGFIRRLCREIGCTIPAHVYLSYDASASVFYPTSIANLFVAPPRNLQVGLGLVQQLDLVEFKALLAHEFGHFSQRTLRLGSYVSLVHCMLWNMLHVRDRWDNWMIGGLDVPVLSAVVVPLFMVVDGLRSVLGWFFRLLNLAYLSLGRQMEFNADRVAVGAAGSDALVHVLFKGTFATDALNRAAADLALAGEHKLYSRDVYYHQERATQALRAAQNNPQLGLAPVATDPGATVQVFAPPPPGKITRWASHPSDYDRERNAKERYLPSPRDERSPWMLFDNPDAVREEVTRQFYWVRQRADPQDALVDPEHIQTFVDDERSALSFDARYRGVYDNRYLELAHGLLEHAQEADAPTPERLACELRGLYSDALQDWVAGLRRRLEENGQRWSDEDREYLARFDRSVYALHYHLAERAGEVDEYRQRYAFHLELQQMLHMTWDHVGRIEYVLNFLASRKSINVDEISGLIAPLLDVRDGLAELYERAEHLTLPPLPRVQAGDRLRTQLPPQPETSHLGSSDTALNPAALAAVHGQVLAIADRLNRLQIKSLNGILKQQENLAGAWAAHTKSAAE